MPKSEDDEVFDLSNGEKVTPERMFAAVKATRDQLKTTEARLSDAESRQTKAEEKSKNTVWAVIGIGFIVMALAIGFAWKDARANARQNERFSEFAFCQAQYNKANSEISKIRAELTSRYNANSARYNANSRKLNLTVGTIVAAGKGNINKAFSDYNAEDARIQQELAKIETARADNPLPVYPDCYNKYIRESVPSGTQDRE